MEWRVFAVHNHTGLGLCLGLACLQSLPSTAKEEDESRFVMTSLNVLFSQLNDFMPIFFLLLQHSSSVSSQVELKAQLLLSQSDLNSFLLTRLYDHDQSLEPQNSNVRRVEKIAPLKMGMVSSNTQNKEVRTVTMMMMTMTCFVAESA